MFSWLSCLLHHPIRTLAQPVFVTPVLSWQLWGPQ